MLAADNAAVADDIADVVPPASAAIGTAESEEEVEESVSNSKDNDNDTLEEGEEKEAI